MKTKILFQLSGSIACFKACQVISKLAQGNYEVRVAASRSALEFIGRATLEGLSGHSVASDLWENGTAMDHIHLVRWADLIILAPATANHLSKLANGIGDDLITTMSLAHDFSKPYLIAPAMNTAMFNHPATQKNLAQLSQMGYQILDSGKGQLACGEFGSGRLMEPGEMLIAIESYLSDSEKTSKKNSPRSPSVKTDSVAFSSLAEFSNSKNVLVTAGGTEVPIDAVRSITNHSSGQTGVRLAKHLTALGYRVTLLASEKTKVFDFEGSVRRFLTVEDLQEEMVNVLGRDSFEFVFHAAAVSDFKLDKTSSEKISSQKELILKLVPGPKLISNIAAWSLNKDVEIVGFKLTAENLNGVSAESKESRWKTAVSKVFSNSKVSMVIHNDKNEISKDRHPFYLWKDSENFSGPISSIEEVVDEWMFSKIKKHNSGGPL